jgi:chaperonin GroEL (HSP60 family)
LVDVLNDVWFGIDVNTGVPANFKEKGIIDPTKVARTALQNAVSVAGTVLLTECTITQDRESVSERIRQFQNQGGGNQPEGDETEQSVSQETSNKKPTGVGFDTKVSGSIRGDYFR